MRSQLAQQYHKKLEHYFIQVNSLNSQHIDKHQLKYWLALCLNDQDIAQNSNLQQLNTRIQEEFELWVDGYLREVCNLDSQTIQKVEFKQEETIEFFNWLIDSQTVEQDQQEQQDQIENQQETPSNTHQLNQQQAQDENQQTSPKTIQNKSKLTQNYSNLNKNQSQLSQKSSTNQNPHSTHSPNQNLFNQQEPNEFSQDLTQSEPLHQNHPEKDLKNLENSTQLIQDDDRYKDYLETIFQHYCKISFGLAKDNTFESMQKNVSIITMNKFMIFSNDFQLNILLAASMPKENNQKPTKIQIRNLLMEIFKKNSAFHKEMSFQQFVTALQRIAEICFAKMKQQSESQKEKLSQNPKTKFSFEMVKMIKYLEISTFKEFKQKMTKFNINFSLKFNKQLQEKKLPINYKFKFESQENVRKISEYNNQRSVPSQNRPPVVLPSEKRNIVLKQGEQNVNKPKYSLEAGKPPLQNKMSTPNMMSLGINNVNNQVPKEKKIGSNKNISSHQKLSNVASNRERNILNFNSQPQKKPNKQSLEYIFVQQRKLKAPVASYEGVLEGYANIHLAKKGLLPIDLKNGMKKKGDFQLNNVIEQARRQAQDPRVHYDYLDSRSGRALSNISASKPLSHYSRDPASNQSYRNERNDQELDLIRPTESFNKQMKKNFTEVPALSKNHSRVNSVHNQLEGLIDFNDSDDEYLHQHLKKQKQKENDTEITVRVQKKISSLNFKP